MTRQQLEHIIRASAGNANVRDVVIIGSQAVLGTYPDAPEELTRSMEALAAGREKDVAFVRTMIQKKLVSPNVIRERLAATPQLQPAIAELALAQLAAMER